jgi:hypothetical protein
MRLEKREDLFIVGNLFPLYHPAPDLVDLTLGMPHE